MKSVFTFYYNLWIKSPMAQAHKAKTMMTMMASSVFTRLSSGGMTTEQLLCNTMTDPENFSIKAPSISITNTNFQETDYHSKLSGLAGRCRTCRTCRGCSTCWPRARAGDGRLMLMVVTTDVAPTESDLSGAVAAPDHCPPPGSSSRSPAATIAICWANIKYWYQREHGPDRMYYSNKHFTPSCRLKQG